MTERSERWRPSNPHPNEPKPGKRPLPLSAAGTSPHADVQMQLLNAQLQSQGPLELGEIDRIVWDDLAVEPAEIIKHKVVGQRCLRWTHVGIAWASSPQVAQTSMSEIGGPLRAFADVLAYGLERGDVATAQAATTLLKVDAYEALLGYEASAVLAARAEAEDELDAAAAREAAEAGEWIRTIWKEAAVSGRPIDPTLPAAPRPAYDHAALKHYDERLETFNAISRTLKQRRTKAIEALQEAAARLVTREDGDTVGSVGQLLGR